MNNIHLALRIYAAEKDIFLKRAAEQIIGEAVKDVT